jgi:protein involved in polysaccharide export with SLBB domain
MNKYCLLAFMLFLGVSLQGQSLTGVNVDDLSDTQILSIFQKGQEQGLSIQDGEAMAINMGLSSGEAKKFKSRVEVLNSSTKKVTPTMNPYSSSDKIKENEADEQKYSNNYQNYSSNIFGHSYFNSDIKAFDQSSGAKAPSNYILGSGDELTISVFGISYFQGSFKVDENGVLNLGPKFGRVNVRGLEFSDVEKIIKSKMSRAFNLSKNTFRVNLSYGRSISVNITGDVRNPGTYSLAAVNNAFHALVMAGGPNKIGSLRNVRVYRNGEVIKTIDFYKFFINPDGFEIPFLQDGDFLMVPTTNNLVTTSGAFKREMIFEMLPNETVSDLIKFTSGFSANAYSKKIKIYRSNDSERKIIDAELKDFSSLLLNDGDSVFANVKNGKLENFITIEGALAQPGDYGFVEGMTIRDAIHLAGGVVGRNISNEISLSRLMSNGFYEITLMTLSNEDALNMKLYLLDNIFIGSKSLDSKEKTVSVIGAVKKAGNYVYSKGMTLEDALNRAGGLELFSDNQRIEITRQSIFINKNGFQEIVKSTKTLSLDASIKENWSDEYKKSDYKLEPFDEISIRSIKKFGLNEKVYISGFVEFPGYYSILENDEKISDVILRAGGISSESDITNAVFYRKNKDQVVFNLDNALNGGVYNYKVNDLDSIHVPQKLNSISITGDGHIYFDEFRDSSISVPIIKNYRSYKYVKEFSLGLVENARKKDIYVSYPNGKLNKSKRILFFWTRSPEVGQGAVIHVNKKPVKTKVIRERKPLDWNQVVGTLTSAAMGFGTVYALINRP